MVAAPNRMDSPVVLDTARLTLKLPGAEAASQMVTYFETNRSHLAPWEPPFPKGLFTNAFWERRLVQNQQEYRTGKSLRLVLFSHQAPGAPHGSVVGLANFTQFVRGAFMGCTLGYSIDQDEQGKGLMREGLEAAIAHVFDQLGVHRIQANYIPTNERSGKLLRRLGFSVEGYARDYIFINGAWRDHVLTSRINSSGGDPEYVRDRPRPRSS